MAGHWVTLPVPDRENDRLLEAVSALPQAGERKWHLVHFLYGKCRCSQRTLDYLFERERPEEVAETLVLVDPNEEQLQKAATAQLEVETVQRAALKDRFGIESAPLLLIVNPSGEVTYSGGYTTRKQGLDFQDVELLNTAQANQPATPLPLYGCGVSRELQRYLDPIGLKYRD